MSDFCAPSARPRPAPCRATTATSVNVCLLLWGSLRARRPRWGCHLRLLSHFWPMQHSPRPAALFTHFREPVMITEGSMQYLFDEKGRRYLDVSRLLAQQPPPRAVPRAAAAAAARGASRARGPRAPPPPRPPPPPPPCRPLPAS